MRLALAFLIICMPALSAGMQDSVPTTPTLTAGSTGTYELAGPDAAHFELDATGLVRIKVENLGRDTILSVNDSAGKRLFRSAGWRGPEHYYVAVVDLAGAASLIIEPDDPISPPGKFSIRVDAVSPSDPALAAELAMTQATDLNLAFYYGEGDTREDARKQYLLAADLFLAAQDRRRRADALYEAANVSKGMCKQDAALEQFESAGRIWSDFDDDRSLAVAENMSGLIHWERGEIEIAIPLFESAAKHRNSLDDANRTDRYFYAETINNLGLARKTNGDAQLAMQHFREALKIWQGGVELLDIDVASPEWPTTDKSPWLHHALTALNNVGWATEMFGDIEETEGIWTRALVLSRHREFGDMTARLQNNLGNLKRRTGKMNEALELLEQSLDFFTERSPNEYWASAVLFSIGQAHKDLGDNSRALDAFKKSLNMRSPDCDPVGRARVLHEIAELSLADGRVDQALRQVGEAEALLETFNGNYSTKAGLVNLAGRALYETGHFDDALMRQDEAIRLYRSAGDRLGELEARTDRAMTSRRLGRSESAIAELKAAAEIAERVDSRLDLFRIYTLLGETYLADNDTESAFQYASRAIERSEQVRREIVRPILVRDFAALQRAAFDILVRVRLRQGQIEQALSVADDARARRFTDVIRRDGVDIKALTDQQRDRYVYLVQAIAVRAEKRTAFLSRNQEDSADLVRQQLAPLIEEMDFLQEQARAAVPESIAPSSLLTSAQATLGDNDTILEYYIGPDMSGVWAVNRDGISFSPIADSEKVANDVEAVLKSIRDQRRPSGDALARLSRTLLGKNGFLAAEKDHLIIIPDGPLHHLPFAVLPDPSFDEDPLIVRRRLSYLPSVHALLELRSRAAPPTRDAAEGIAILADPVFEANDPRMQRPADAPEPVQVAWLDRELRRGAERSGVVEFPRLSGSISEAIAIRNAAGDQLVLTLTDTDANRDVVLSGQLDEFEILHFATHGILDAEEPALSGLVLSGVDKDGTPRSRFLRSQDIAGLTLSARLVVLSGCETGLGRLVHGEGLLGLSRAFFYAGANQVVSTLWPVPDRTTAELMGHFYYAHLHDKLSVPDALRQAQLKVRENAASSSPFYWAAFIVQGDWVEPPDQD
jgi:CHAT domain-containing protein